MYGCMVLGLQNKSRLHIKYKRVKYKKMKILLARDILGKFHPKHKPILVQTLPKLVLRHT